ncbi:MAG: sigma 54-interacting transcriptional regulator [Peptostreptococcaceae bacterium]|nr:sigma 54-interacting transcriptional regulator [Peptostreptococcaceae bacterium]
MYRDFIFCSQEMKDIYELAKRYSRYESTVMIEGETGVGKEIIANIIHEHSPRCGMPFLKINCSAISESLLDSELFGYESGSFTGANIKGRSGIFESADKGSLLLDEVGELSYALQVKLLRVLQEHEIRRVGGTFSKPVDVRIITCTNLNLSELVLANKFRKDLYFRLNVAKINIPPLRDHRSDVLPLTEYFLDQYCLRYQTLKKFSDQALFIISNHSFPGNIRELKNIVESSFITSKDAIITVEDLPEYLLHQKNQTDYSLSNQLDRYEKDIISNALASSSSIRGAARMLRVSNATLLRRIKKYQLRC